jgi:hypothetical protein
MARWLVREPHVPRDAVIELIVLWFMKGYEQIIPNEAWRGTRVLD